MIQLRNLEKAYDQGGGKVYVQRRIDAEVRAGEFVSIMGPSGAGKSTLLHILGMHDGAFTGEFVFLDQPVHRLGRKERLELQKRNIGFVFQSYHLLDDLTVYENLEVPLSYRDVKRSERQGGQQQLVAVARAVVASPRVILADEPTGNLHSDQGREIMELFKKLNDEGTTIIQVTHSEVNAGYGDRVIKLRDGWIVE